MLWVAVFAAVPHIVFQIRMFIIHTHVHNRDRHLSIVRGLRSAPRTLYIDGSGSAGWTFNFIAVSPLFGYRGIIRQ